MLRHRAGRTWLATLVLLSLAALPGWAASLRLAVVAQDTGHLAWDSARLLQGAARTEGLSLLLEPAATDAQSKTQLPDLVVMPLRSLANRIPALEILELPFLYADLNAVHRAVDGALGTALRDIARQQQWEILAFWDEGLHVMSGLRRYDRVANLNGMEFLLTRPEPVIERQLQAWRATPRTIRQADREAVLRECLIASRAATLQEIQREGLERVHMTLSITRHRYEGWLLLAPATRWTHMPEATRETLIRIMPQVPREQRAAAARREADALQALRKAGFVVHAVDVRARQAFVDRLLPWSQLLSKTIDATTRARLLTLNDVSDDSNRLQKQVLPAAAAIP